MYLFACIYYFEENFTNKKAKIIYGAIKNQLRFIADVIFL
ncbi:hypothetical protein SRABI04_00662 [Chryseobacterium sp. Bi04]|nr:hypothetical protein SRABI04_00662 [Chryseobacterium sp. Bi04]